MFGRLWHTVMPPRTSVVSMLTVFLGFTPMSFAEGPVIAQSPGEHSGDSAILADIATRHPRVRAMVVANADCVTFEYYRKDIGVQTQSTVNSITKSVLSTLIGIAVNEGLLRLDDKLSDVFPREFDEKIDPLARNITLRNLLTKTEGFEEGEWGHFSVGAGASGKPQIWRWMLNRKVKYSPGTHFRYDGIGSDLLSVVLSAAIRQNATDFARQKLFGPLHISNYTWQSDTEGYLPGEYGLYLTARDMAKIGVLYLRHGRWKDQQIVSEDYVRDATTKHSDGGPPVNAGYGYQWWVGSTNPYSFFATGRNGQVIYIVPTENLVLTVSADYHPWESQKYFRDVLVPAAAKLSHSPLCAAQFD